MNAMLSAVFGGGFTATAVVIGAERSQAFAACCVFHAHEHIRRTCHVTVSKTDETLHVGVIDLAHNSATQSRASSSVMDDLSRPWRIRVFLSRSIALSPG